MNEARAIIERIRRINSQYQYLELAISDEGLAKIKPGQSLLVRLQDPESEMDTWHPYLREQWYPAGFTSSGLLLIERPFSESYQPQQVISVLGPIGQPYRFRKSLRNVLLIAYDTPPTPLTIMIGQLLNNQISVTLVLLGSARNYETSHLAPEVEVIQGNEHLVWAEQVMTLGWADQIFVVAKQDDELMRFSEVMFRIRELRNDVPENYVFGVFQPLLPCGIGACAACLLRVNDELVPNCTKGPTFDLTTVYLPK